MKYKRKRFFNPWIEEFPYPVLLADHSGKIILANSVTLQRSDIYNLFDDCANSYNRDMLTDFFYNTISSHYSQEDIEFARLGDSNLIGRAIYRKSHQYLLLVLFPKNFKTKFLHLQLKYDTIMNFVTDSIIVTDSEQKIEEVNRAFTHITGYEFDEVVGRFPTLLSSGRHEKNFYKEMFQQMEIDGYFQGNITDRKKNGELIFAKSSIIPIKDHNSNVKNYIGILEDVTELSKLKHNIITTQHKDSLTGVHNRESFLNILEIKCEVATVESQLAILFIDLNKFKQVNDTYGHGYGDFVLSTAANRIQKSIRDSDFVGRYGGDEFVVLLERVTQEKAYEISQKIEKILSRPYVVDEQVISFISGSIGIAFAPVDSKVPRELIEKADIAMYQAKKDISGSKIFFSNSIIEDHSNNKELKTELLSAIDNHEFYIRIQPIVCTKTQKIVGGEILSRWLNLHFNEIMPSTFIPLVQTLGISKKFDTYVLYKTIEILEEQDMLSDNFFIHINFSPEQFNDPMFITLFEELLKVKPWISKHLVIEILESTMMVNIERTTQHLNAIRNLGFKIAIDDFGTGFSSLSYLKNFAIDYLKIDKSFIDNIEYDSKDFEIVKTICTLANAIGAKVIAEGIETKAQYEMIKSLNIEYIQGFYFHRPLLVDSFYSKVQT